MCSLCPPNPRKKIRVCVFKVRRWKPEKKKWFSPGNSPIYILFCIFMGPSHTVESGCSQQTLKPYLPVPVFLPVTLPGPECSELTAPARPHLCLGLASWPPTGAGAWAPWPLCRLTEDETRAREGPCPTEDSRACAASAPWLASSTRSWGQG